MKWFKINESYNYDRSSDSDEWKYDDAQNCLIDAKDNGFYEIDWYETHKMFDGFKVICKDATQAQELNDYLNEIIHTHFSFLYCNVDDDAGSTGNVVELGIN